MTRAAELTAAALVVGGGISGMAAAAACAAPTSDRPVVVLDRGRRLGGRMAARTLRSGPWSGHVVDLGAAYFTVSHPAFAAVVAEWRDRGLVREWTDRFAVADPSGITGSTTGPMRYAAPGGLRSLVEDLAAQAGAGVVVQHPTEAAWLASAGSAWQVAGIDTGSVAEAAEARLLTAPAVALCVPPPQAVELLATPPDAPRDVDGRSARSVDAAGEELWWAAADYAYEPILALVAQWPHRCWDDFAGCFVNGDEALSFIADDGDRRGDGAAVLVAHSTPGFAARHLLDPPAATTELTGALCRVLGLAPPAVTEVKRWGLARPATTDPQHRDAGLAAATDDGDAHGAAAPGGEASHSRPRDGAYLLAPGGTIGIASDAFDPRPRVEAAWLSGHYLGIALNSATTTA